MVNHATSIVKKNTKKRENLLLDPCSCKKKCLELINEERQKKIHSDFWTMTFREQGTWLNQTTDY